MHPRSIGDTQQRRHPMSTMSPCRYAHGAPHPQQQEGHGAADVTMDECCQCVYAAAAYQQASEDAEEIWVLQGEASNTPTWGSVCMGGVWVWVGGNVMCTSV